MSLHNTKQVSPLMTRRIIWLAMTQGVVLICGIILFSGIKSHNPPPLYFETIRYIFLLLTVTTVLSLGKIRATIDPKPPVIPSQVPSRSGSKSNSGFLIVMAICEGSIIMGVILTYFSGNPNDIYVLAAPGFIGMLLNFPREE